MNTETLNNYLADINHLTDQSTVDGKKYYVHPKLKNLGCVNLVVIREALAPVVFRNAEQEITDIEVDGDVYVRAVPNKFKYVERGRGLQILRALGVGGKQAQNKTVLYKGQQPSDAFDLNALVFGDSANFDSRVLPVKAAVHYSDALSLQSKHLCVDETFHNRAMEDGTLYDAEKGKNSDNLFTRHFIKPGTLMVQVLSSRGKMLPEIALKHLLLSVGMAGSYGGQTSVTGTNIRTHIVGLYADQFEKAITSPYALLAKISNQGLDVMTTQATLHELLAPEHALSIAGGEVTQWQQALIEAFNQTGSELEKEYQQARPKVAELFDQWFQ
ncbi:type I-D CRISPR-associated protein Cas7/Csc2 [Thiothrix nivea]|uniref:CRISPR-associated protein Csc2 n=1 Tax=Thiothrix nivea (strain ATCC 35100 / DSM 5205 / JP2) TaxID=870187 RepID=A0A656HBN9_THINJ|nr:type I-D CRISPR-associated protein Cas7/Csc2 [Thiothrix nivea]EIJ32870.1 CRISPR-associated protein Csc2 [Thiothrix nivea DSM 5205]